MYVIRLTLQSYVYSKIRYIVLSGAYSHESVCRIAASGRNPEHPLGRFANVTKVRTQGFPAWKRDQDIVAKWSAGDTAHTIGFNPIFCQSIVHNYANEAYTACNGEGAIRWPVGGKEKCIFITS